VTRAGLAAILGRPNVGKSTLLNSMVGAKVSITAPTPHTTRGVVRGVLTEGDVQVVFVDTPGLHRPRSTLGGRMNDAARASARDVDAVIALLDARTEIGAGDRATLEAMASAAAAGASPFLVLNKVDAMSRERVAAALLAAQGALGEVGPGALERVEYFPVSARRGTGVDELAAAVAATMPESPFYFDADEVSDVPEAVWVAELVREQLARKMRQELPTSIHCRVTEFDGTRVSVEILVERESQKGMVIGRGGAVLKDVGTAARAQMPEGTHLDLRVRVEPGWSGRPDVLDRLGY
jgi:GTPase